MDISAIAQDLRQLVVKSLVNAGSGHSAGSIGMADVLSVIYFSNLFKLDPNNPEDPERDRIILSGGHICPLLYAALAKRGYFPIEELESLRSLNSRLQGHPHKSFHDAALPIANLPGVENTSGPLGQGIGFAVGLSLGLRHQWESGRLNHLPRVICLCGDGELQEGQVWEAFMSASKFKLNHLTFIIDRNGIQIDGFTEDVMPLEPLKDKLQSFGLLAVDVDGHNPNSLMTALKFDAAYQTKPTVLIAHTTPGKGIDFMEGRPVWHGKTPNIGEAVEALQELRSLQNSIIND